MGQCSIFAFCFQIRELVFLQRTMTNDESNILPCSKRAFYDALEGVPRKFSGGSPQTPVSLPLCLDSS